MPLAPSTIATMIDPAQVQWEAPLERQAQEVSMENLVSAAHEVGEVAAGLAALMNTALTHPIGQDNAERLGRIMAQFDLILSDLRAMRPVIARAIED